MSWLSKIRPSGLKTQGRDQARSVPEGIWMPCPKCAVPLYRPELERNLEVCPKCSHHIRIGARRRLDIFLDPEGRSVRLTFRKILF